MSIVSLGELLIDFVSLEHGVSVGDAPGFKKAPGGAPANVAVAVARLGQPSAFMGQVGHDEFGDALVRVMKAEDVDVRGVAQPKGSRTILAFVSLAANGERTFSFYGHTSEVQVTPEQMNLSVLDGRKIFHFGSLTMIYESGKRMTMAAVEGALARDMFISYDPNRRQPLCPDDDKARAVIIEALPYAHFVKVSDEELRFLTGGDDPAPLWRERTQVICVTRGADGATVYTRNGRVDVEGFKVSAKDTTGAGDSFVAAMLCGIVEHFDDYAAHLPEITRFACAVGALTTTQLGAIPSLPTRAAAEAFMREQG